MRQSSQSNLIRAVLVDDHQVVRAGIRAFLEGSKRIQVVAEGSDGSQAIELNNQYHPDVLVMDIQMPRLSGIEATRKIRASGSKVKILILTAYDDKPYVQALFKAGANGYMIKTAEPNEVIHAIEDVVLGKIKIDRSLLEENPVPFQSGNRMNGELFTEREMELLRLVAQGMANKEIALTLSISSRTVQNHLANMFKKANCASRTELITLATRLNLIEPDFDRHKPKVVA